MHYSSIRKHLKPYLMVARRKTTINHAFAAAIAPNDEYCADVVQEAMAALGQDPESLLCAYCDAPAQTWDHVFATVKDSNFSGYGHRLGNLLPCCKSCNSSKGNKNWRSFLCEGESTGQLERIARIESYLSKYSSQDSVPNSTQEYQRMHEIKVQVMALLAEADELAKMIRAMAVNEAAEKKIRGLSLETRMDFAPGVPDDPKTIPTLHYQVLMSKVFTIMRWPDGSTARGETSLTKLEGLIGKPVTQDGWYDLLGKYLGEELPGAL